MLGSGASARVMCAIRPAALAAPPLAYLMSVLIVHAASSDVSGLPSLHFAFGVRWNVQVLPPSVEPHDLA